jgi:hypothetical protein
MICKAGERKPTLALGIADRYGGTMTAVRPAFPTRQTGSPEAAKTAPARRLKPPFFEPAAL